MRMFFLLIMFMWLDKDTTFASEGEYIYSTVYFGSTGQVIIPFFLTYATVP